MAATRDLIVVVPDGALYNVIQSLLLKRRLSIQIREITFDVIKDPLRDASPESNTVDLLRGFLRSHTYAIVLRDLSGSGWEQRGASQFEQALLDAMVTNGWRSSCVSAVVIEPEIEAWLRLESPHVQSLVATRARKNADRSALLFQEAVQRAIAKNGGEVFGKAKNPKEAFESLLEEFGIPRSTALYRHLAERESLEGCQVTSFCKLIALLREWFPRNSSP